MASNDFLIFDEQKENMLSQEVYSVDTDREEGFKTGLARSNVMNKVLYQISKMCHTFGEILKDNEYNVTDAMTVEELKTAIINTFSSESVLQRCYPVGSFYFSANDVSPATVFGFGTWEQVKDRFLLACGDLYENGTTGGASTVALTIAQMPSHNHSASTNNTGAHTHTRGTMDIKGRLPGEHYSTDTSTWDYKWWNRLSGAFYKDGTTNTKVGVSGYDNDNTDISFQASKNWTGATSSNGGHTHTVTINKNGSGGAHNNMPPYLAVYIWQRVA